MAQEPLNDLLDELTRSGLVAPGQLDAATIDQSGEKPSHTALADGGPGGKADSHAVSSVASSRRPGRRMRHRRPLSRPRQARPGRHGRGLQAHDIQLDRDVAVKVLPSHCLNDADAVTRFQREVAGARQALASEHHPGPRQRRGQRPSLPGHGIRRWSEPVGDSARAGGDATDLGCRRGLSGGPWPPARP